MSKPVRVRFAPSPTGPLHIGGVRTALYNYLFAKKQGGSFILRIEDTDQTRYVKGAEQYIHEALAWSGILPDEGPEKGGAYGPYRQSDRKEMYGQYVQQLIDADKAYYAFDTAAELTTMREQAKKAKMPNWQYNSITRNSMKNSLTLSQDEVQAKLDAGEPHAIRIKIPRNEEVRFHDTIRGWIVVNTSNLDDKVIFKSDGMPTYHMANVVDDYKMKISHVIRGEEWLPSAPLHVLLYQYLGWEEYMPEFAHLPLILKPDGNGKLSKRDGDRLGFPVFPLNWNNPETGETASGYREQGYFPEAFTNMLAFLGWNPGSDHEIYPLNELIQAFSLERVGKAGAKFDAKKTVWFNEQYLKKTSNEHLAELLQPLLKDQGLEYNVDQLPAICDLLKERASFLNDMIENGMYFFKAPSQYDEKTIKKKWNENSVEIIQDLKTAFSHSNYSPVALKSAFETYLAEKELNFGKVGPVLRVAVTGSSMGPSLFDICSILGKDEVEARMNNAVRKLG